MRYLVGSVLHLGWNGSCSLPTLHARNSTSSLACLRAAKPYKGNSQICFEISIPDIDMSKRPGNASFREAIGCQLEPDRNQFSVCKNAARLGGEESTVVIIHTGVY